MGWGEGVMGNTRCVRIVAGQLVVATSLGRRRGGGGVLTGQPSNALVRDTKQKDMSL